MTAPGQDIISLQYIIAVLPEIVLLAGGLIILMIEAFISGKRRGVTPTALLVTIAAMVISFYFWNYRGDAFFSMITVDAFSHFFDLIFLAGLLLTILLSESYMKRVNLNRGEYYALLFFAVIGMMLMAKGKDLLVIFLGLELLSLSLYILVGFIRNRLRSNESALKFMLLGAFSSAFFLYGIALIYGNFGSTNLTVISSAFTGAADYSPVVVGMGMGLLIVGFGFKVALVPFHMWSPDVYQGAPTSITAFISTGPKAAGFAAFLRVFIYSFRSIHDDWMVIVWIISVLTMTAGNLIAIRQQNVKRLLAYSSIAHAGYILIGILAANDLGISSILYYLLVYTFMNIGAFGIVLIMERAEEKGLEVEDYRGLGHTSPFISLVFTIFLISLAGIPPTAGFFAKFYLFSAAIKAKFYLIAVIGVLNSVVSVYYYLRIVVHMFMLEPERELAKPALTPLGFIAILISGYGIIHLGLFPADVLKFAMDSISSLF